MKIYKKIYSLLILSTIQICPFLMNSQTTFQKVYPASINQGGQDVLPTSDGGYIIAGNTETNIVNDLDILITKTDNLGNISWTKTYGGSKPDYPNCILKTSDGYLIVGYSQSFGGGDEDIYLLKINTFGDTLWTKVYGGSGNEDGKEIVATADGNYVIAGGSNSLNYSNNDMELLKIDPLGNKLWTKYYGYPSTYESARSVKLCLDGGFILAGKTATTDTSGDDKIFVVKTNSSGDTLWTKQYGDPDAWDAKSILANNDGSYTMCIDDSSASHDSDVRVMKISSTGTVIWNKSYGGIDKDICKMIQPTTDGGYIVAAISRSFGWINPNMWLLRLNTMGDTLWTKPYGGAGHEHCLSAKQTPDGGFVAVGQTRSFSVNTETMLVKTDPLGITMPVGIENYPSLNNSITFYPNPTDGLIQIKFTEDISSPAEIIISNLLGQAVYSEKVNNMKNAAAIDLKGQKTGLYFLNIKANNQSSTAKIVLE